MQEMGKAMMGTGEASGDNRALEAAQKAIANPLLDGVSMQGAKGVIISITGGDDMRLLEVDEAANHIRDLVDPDANIIWGSAFNPELEGQDPRLGRRHRVSRRPHVPPPPRAEPTRSFSFGGARKSEDARRPRSARASPPRSRSPEPSRRTRAGADRGSRGCGSAPPRPRMPPTRNWYWARRRSSRPRRAPIDDVRG